MTSKYFNPDSAFVVEAIERQTAVLGTAMERQASALERIAILLARLDAQLTRR